MLNRVTVWAPDSGPHPESAGKVPGMGMRRSWTRQGRQGLVMAAVAPVSLLLGIAPAVAAHASGKPRPAAASPTVTGPVTGGKGAIVLQGTSFDLGRVGYTQSEFFLSGNASSYAPAAPLGSDG